MISWHKIHREEEYLPGIRIRSPLQAIAACALASSAWAPTLKAVHGSPAGAAVVGKLIPFPTAIAEPQGWSGQS